MAYRVKNSALFFTKFVLHNVDTCFVNSAAFV